MPRYSDAFLIQVVEKAARRINRRLCLTNTSEQISVDSSGCLSTSDPNLEDLVLLQAECMIMNIDTNSDYTLSADGAGGGYLAKDGEQTFDTRGEVASRVKARAMYFNTSFNPCAELERAIVVEKLNRQCDMRDIW